MVMPALAFLIQKPSAYLDVVSRFDFGWEH